MTHWEARLAKARKHRDAREVCSRCVQCCSEGEWQSVNRLRVCISCIEAERPYFGNVSLPIPYNCLFEELK